MMKPSEEIIESLKEFDDMPPKEIVSEKIKGVLNPVERAILKWLDKNYARPTLDSQLDNKESAQD